MTPTITPIIEEKRQLGAAVAIVDVIFEIVEVIKKAAAADEEVRFLMSITADFRSMRNRVCKNSATLAMLTHDVTMPALRQHTQQAKLTYTALIFGVHWMIYDI